MLDDRVIGQSLPPDANPRRAGTGRNSLRLRLAATGIFPWHEIRDGAHARSRQAFRPVQSTHQSSSCRLVGYERVRQSVAAAKREFGRFVLSGLGLEACA